MGFKFHHFYEQSFVQYNPIFTKEDLSSLYSENSCLSKNLEARKIGGERALNVLPSLKKTDKFYHLRWDTSRSWTLGLQHCTQICVTCIQALVILIGSSSSKLLASVNQAYRGICNQRKQWIGYPGLALVLQSRYKICYLNFFPIFGFSH